MSTNWKYKFYGTVFVALMSVYLLIPTFMGLKEKREQIETSGADEPWYYKILPSDELNLGLDLRGGLYLELEVGIEDALAHQLSYRASEINRYVLKDELEGVSIAPAGERFLRVEVPDAKKDVFRGALLDTFGTKDMTVIDKGPELMFTIKGDPDAARKKALTALQGIVGFKGDITTTADKKFFAVAYTSETERNQLLAKLTAPELTSNIEPAQPDNILYIRASDEYVAKLKKDIIEQAANAVRNRIDRYGVAEASVSRQGGDRLVVELPGAKNPEHLIDIIKRTGKLEFRLVNDTMKQEDLVKLVDDKKKALGITTPYEGDALIKLNDALKADIPENTEVMFSLDRDPSTKVVRRSKPYLLSKEAQVTGEMLENSRVESDRGIPYVSMTFNKLGTKNFGDITEANIGKRFAVVLDSIVMIDPVIKSAITSGQAKIELGTIGSRESLEKEAREDVLILREGALPATLKIASKNVIGPSLGQDAIDTGLKSVFISSIAIMIFMILYYRTGGFVSNIALLLNIVLLFAILCLFQASISLPGLAGIALTNGMAVDANVIIFARMREERYLGHNLMQVIESGYKHAMNAIIDGHMTIFISGLVLFEFGSGPIKGFATTLIIGILCTLFTSIVVTKMIFEWLVLGRKVQSLAY